jgi:pimeloyl-ACP methyl ester carboxylesterase
VSADRAFFAASQVSTAGVAFATPVTRPAWRGKPTFYVLSTEDRIIPPAAQRQMAGRAKATVTEVPARHAVYISQPNAVADAIDCAAQAASR